MYEQVKQQNLNRNAQEDFKKYSSIDESSREPTQAYRDEHESTFNNRNEKAGQVLVSPEGVEYSLWEYPHETYYTNNENQGATSEFKWKEIKQNPEPGIKTLSDRMS